MPTILEGLTAKGVALDDIPIAHALYVPRDGGNTVPTNNKSNIKHSTKNSPAKKKTPTKHNSGPLEKAIEIWCGVPEEPLEGGWAEGWLCRKFQRQGGLSKGHCDRYWYSPQTGKKFRSMAEIKRFMPLLTQCNGDENMAWDLFKKK